MEETHKKKSAFGVIMKYLVPLAITVGLCWAMFAKIDFSEMMVHIRSCNFWWMGLMLIFGVLALVARAARWRLQLRAIGVDPPLSIVILSIFGTYAVNLVFPRLGEIWRCTYVAHRQNAQFSSVLGSMIADRLADTITVALLALMAMGLAYTQMSSFLHQPENIGLYAKLAAFFKSPWLWGALAALAALTWWLLAHNKRLRAFARSIWQGFAVVAKMRGKGKFLLLTVAIWGCFFLSMLSSFMAFPFTVQVMAKYGLMAVMVTFVITSISMGVPSQGGIGPYQWACIIALAFYGVSDAQGLSFGTLVLGMNTLMTIILGLFTFVCIMLDKRRNSTFARES